MVTQLVKPQGERLAMRNGKVFKPNSILTLQLRTICAIVYWPSRRSKVSVQQGTKS
jgi:hypothetical protein